MKIVFMGTPQIAADVLSIMSSGGFTPGLIVTQPDREKNRGKKVLPSEVKLLGEELGIPILQPERVKENEAFFEELRAFKPDIAVVVAYGKILPKEVLEIPRFGCINVHASILPKYRGASPIQHAILCGEEKTGVTIIQMDEGMDTGDMLLKRELAIDNMNAEELSRALGKIGGELILEVLPLIEGGNATLEKQDDSKATYTKMIRKEDGRINFADYTALEIASMINAYYPWPGVSVPFEGNMMKLCKVEVLNSNQSVLGFEPGDVVAADDSGISVLTKEGLISIKELQLPGKNKVTADAFLRGHKITKESFKN